MILHHLVLAFLSLQTQVAPTVPSTFLGYKGIAYFPSPTYVVESASPDERFLWSADGTRLAYVSDVATETPSQMERRVASAQKPRTMTRLGIWSRDAGRGRDLIQAGDPTLGIDRFVFLGHDLAFTTFSQTSDGTKSALWIARDGSQAKQVDLPGEVAGAGLAVSKDGTALLVVTDAKLWLLDPSSTRQVKVPGFKNFFERGTTADNRAIVHCLDGGGQPATLLVELSTGNFIQANNSPTATNSAKLRPFILDGYSLSGRKIDLDDDGLGHQVDSRAVPIMDEDGGFRADLVETVGPTRRRIRFMNEMSNTLQVSNDGLSFAFVSNGLLMVRWMVKADAKTSATLLAKDAGL